MVLSDNTQNTMNIDPIVSNYIDVAVERERKIFRKDFAKFTKESKQHMTDLKTFFSIELGKVLEATIAKPTVERVREIALEELKPTKIEISLITKEIGLINQKIR